MTDRLQSLPRATTESIPGEVLPTSLEEMAMGNSSQGWCCGYESASAGGPLVEGGSSSACHRDGARAAAVLEGAPWRETS